MRTFYIFKIKKEYAILTKNNPYHMFKLLSYIYNLDPLEVNRGADLFYKLVESFDTNKFDTEIYKTYNDNYFYTKYKNVHQINNYYKKEESRLVIHKHFFTLSSTLIKPTFFDDLSTYDNLFVCDFQNKDYFWLEKITS